MCCMNTGMYNSRYGMGMTGYNQGTMGMYNRSTAGMYSRNIRGTYTCSTVNVIDMSGMISKRIECRPVNNQFMPFRVMYQSML